MNRRDHLALYLTGGAAALLADGCTPQQIDDTQKKLANIINQVQAAVAAACAGAGKWVPTANTVFAILVSIVGSESVAGAVATMVQQAISTIVSVGCPSASRLGVEPKTDKGVPILFY